MIRKNLPHSATRHCTAQSSAHDSLADSDSESAKPYAPRRGERSRQRATVACFDGAWRAIAVSVLCVHSSVASNSYWNHADLTDSNIAQKPKARNLNVVAKRHNGCTTARTNAAIVSQ